MATSKLQELETLFDDHPSLDASLQDFEHNGSSEIAPSSPRASLPYGYPSHHSGFRSETDSDRSPAPSDSGGRYSPPAWRRDRDGNRSSGFWARLPRREDSRESSPEFESADEGEDETLAAARRTRLPTGSLSPEKQGTPAPEGFPGGGGDFGDVFAEGKELGVVENPNNCRFCVTLDCDLDMLTVIRYSICC